MRILVVEDEKKVSSFIKRGLEEEKYEVDTAFDGEEGLKMALERPYEVVVLDWMLPKLDGLSVLKELRAKKRSTPVLMLTAKDTVEDIVAGLDSGSDDYLTKPFAFAELLARVRALLRRSDASSGRSSMSPRRGSSRSRRRVNQPPMRGGFVRASASETLPFQPERSGEDRRVPRPLA